ncbi:polysaccharide deacetylase family protein [Clostridium sp.]|uniref:polysaccharide deacetylase family protein n=1 Tax=Clostridium sp. TaxID=1506 RepID=UPI002FC8BB47
MKNFFKVLSIILLAMIPGIFTVVKYNEKVYYNEDISVNSEILEKKERMLDEAEYLKNGYYIDEAIKLLLSDKEIIDEDINSVVEEYTNYKKNFVKYEGTINHIFFHSLIVYPELAFDNVGHDSTGYNMWFNTTNEFKKMLPLLKEQGFVLMKINDIYGSNKDGNMIRKEIYLPKGKKPLIISQDDVNYYEYMKKDGFADRLIIDENNEVSTAVRNKNNKSEITRDGDMVPILDDFIKDNPEFSYRGAKGILAVTGYEGVLGYRLNSEENIKEAKAVVNKLKETGWLFASHSYTHNGKGYFGESPDYNKLLSDFNRWKDRIQPIIGETNIFIAPFGTTLEGKSFNLAKKFGFDIYCNVSREESKDKFINNTVVNSRFNIDGFSFNKAKDEVNSTFFNVDEVIDKSRPVMK